MKIRFNLFKPNYLYLIKLKNEMKKFDMKK